MDKNFRKVKEAAFSLVERNGIHAADKYLRKKKYVCLFPGCKEKAIRSHAIPRALLIEALAENGVVYTMEQSFNSMMTKTAPTDPPDVIEVGVNDASVFKGFCPAHDSWLFASAEVTHRGRNRAMAISLHLRAVSLEYCRQRQVADFQRKLAELTRIPEMRPILREYAETLDKHCALFKKVYLGSIFNLMSGSSVDSIVYFCVPFSRNLQVSCCGVFDETNDFDSAIGFNLISYADKSILVLTAFKVVKHYLDSFLARYDLRQKGEKLVNDIAFWKCEEPFISPQLWRSLSEEEKLEVRLSLRHPDFRAGAAAPSVIRLTSSDFVTKLAELPDFLLRAFVRKD
jgi:hypothetical protein